MQHTAGSIALLSTWVNKSTSTFQQNWRTKTDMATRLFYTDKFSEINLWSPGLYHNSLAPSSKTTAKTLTWRAREESLARAFYGGHTESRPENFIPYRRRQPFYHVLLLSGRLESYPPITTLTSTHSYCDREFPDALFTFCSTTAWFFLFSGILGIS